MSSQALIDRMIGVARLDVPTYEEIEHDQGALPQAVVVVVASAIAAGIGAIGDNGITGIIGGILGAIVSWIVFSFAVYFVGTRFLATPQTEADTGQLLRTLGFARTPSLLSVFGFIPVLGWILGLIGGIWFLVTSVIAVRQSLEMSTGRAIGTIIVAWIALLIIGLIFAAIFGVAFYGF
jgi:hypothetical protein